MSRRLMSVIVCFAVAAVIAAAAVMASARGMFKTEPAAADAGQRHQVAQVRPAAPGRQPVQAPQTPQAAKAAAAAAGATDARPIRSDEVRKMFDSYVLVQAQQQLKISDGQLPKFLIQFKNLQELRRTTTQEHSKLLQELRKDTADTKSADAQLKEKLKALHGLEEKSHADLRKVYDGIDNLLDARQQVKFRILEQQMQQRMLQLASRPRPTDAPKAAAQKAVK